ncbi:MAG: hypothetical protein JRK53_10800 [Deltaproteobacteria bacterium]|nr:hypothetical protein [Deltaproteobacteria bacterium]MBW1817108.1 hypothetical protein [Deltaproteobacteria bacterium]
MLFTKRKNSFPLTHWGKQSFFALIMVALAAGLVLGGCAKRPVYHPVLAPTCGMPEGVMLDEAIAQVRENLANEACQPRFDAYFMKLLEIASGDPDPEHKRRFSDFLVWANEAGLLTKSQAKEKYNRYFNATFMSLPDEYNVCSSCAGKADILRAMEVELSQKETGLLKACADKKTFYRAYDQFSALKLVLEATCLACDRGA